MTEESLRRLLDFIGDKEAGERGYDQLYSYAENAIGPVTLTVMTVKEVRALQESMISIGSPSSAIGRYQFIRVTLDGLVDEMGLSGDERFDADLQDQLAIRLLDRRGLSKFLNGKITRDQFANGVAHEWASMPCIGGPRHGKPSPEAIRKSCYAGDGLNYTAVKPEAFLAVLDGLKPSTAPSPTPVRPSMSEPKWLRLAREYLGEKEISGSRHNPEIVKWFAESGHSWVKDDETAWCAGFVGAMLSRSGIKGTGELSARSYLNWGKPITDPAPGCIVVFSRGDPNGWQGHVAFFLRDLGKNIEVLGGNQSNSVSIALYPKSRLLGYRMPGTDANTQSMSVADIRRLQSSLKDLGYHEVGRVDGSWGTKTRAALLAFKADNGLPLNLDVDVATWESLETASPRVIGEERANATVADLKSESRIISNTDKIKKAGIAITATSATVKAADETGALEQVEELVGQGTMLQQLIETVYNLVGFVVDYWWVAAPIGGGFIAWWAWKAQKARVEDHRTGKTS